MFNYCCQFFSWAAVDVLAADLNVCCLLDSFESILAMKDRTNILKYNIFNQTYTQ